MDNNKFAPRVDNTKTEKTGERNSDYSLWHRSLGAAFLAVDIDFVEYRQNRGIVAFIAVTGRLNDEKHIMNSKKFIWKRTAVERKIMLELSLKTGVPAFFTIHNNDLSLFHVHNLAEDLSDFKRMNQKEYGDFIKQL
jgi:hypothetical protein